LRDRLLDFRRERSGIEFQARPDTDGGEARPEFLLGGKGWAECEREVQQAKELQPGLLCNS
jgi:hypothetical protein